MHDSSTALPHYVREILVAAAPIIGAALILLAAGVAPLHAGSVCGPDGTPCDDGDFCTIEDRCQSDVCTGQLNICLEENIANRNPCSEFECQGDACVETAINEGIGCDDDDRCTTEEKCTAGQCIGREITCGEQQDLCFPVSCQKGDCIQNEVICTAENAANPNPCTVFECSEGACVEIVSNEGASCDDGDACTSNDVCQNGSCQGVLNSCDLENQENTNPCIAAFGCVSGSCVVTEVSNCDDGDACTLDACDPSTACTHTFADADGDGICDANDPRPGIFDPSGCFYDELTGAIVSGGVVSVAGPPDADINLVSDGEGTGCYQFVVENLDEAPGEYAINIDTVPDGCERSTACPPDPVSFDPTGTLPPCQEDPGAATCTLGAGASASFVLPNDCASNPFFLSFDLEDGDPEILQNHIPLSCSTQPGTVDVPALTLPILAGAVALLALVGLAGIRRLWPGGSSE
jgi:hypothetical protein